MANDKRDLLTVLKPELEFFEKGGYLHTARAEWLPQVMFQDSKVLPCKQFQNMKPSCDTNSEAPWSLVISVACESCGDRSARVTARSALGNNPLGRVTRKPDMWCTGKPDVR